MEFRVSGRSVDVCGDVLASEVSKLSSFVITNFDFVHHLLPDDLLKKTIHHCSLSFDDSELYASF